MQNAMTKLARLFLIFPLLACADEPDEVYGGPAAVGTGGSDTPVGLNGTAGGLATPPTESMNSPLSGITAQPAEPGPFMDGSIEHPAGETVRFIAVGDTGTGEADQLTIAQVMADTCSRDGCDFVVMLGDNIYDKGPGSLDDPQWQTKFEQPYASLDVPFYIVLGNHDVASDGLFGTGYVDEQSVLEVEYTQQSSKWMMPAPHYALSAGPVGLLMLDTTSLYNHVALHGDQHEWVGPARDALANQHAWVLSAGHHTYASNGDHGNAGAYAYFDPDPGTEIKEFFDAHLCGKIDLVLTGHDHNLQWLDGSVCGGTEVVVSGAGAKVRGLPGGNPSHWQSESLGFLYVVADAHTLTGKFIGADGQVDFERTLVK